MNLSSIKLPNGRDAQAEYYLSQLRLLSRKGGIRLDWSSVNLRGVDLTGADLRGANLVGSDFAGADLRGANMMGARVVSADFRGANLNSANLNSANMTDARAVGANLRNVKLWGANLRNVKLLDADIRGADIRGAHGLNDWVKCVQIERYPVTYTSEVIQIGCEQHPIENWRNFSDDQIYAMDRTISSAWWDKWKDWLFATIELAPAHPTK